MILSVLAPAQVVPLHRGAANRHRMPRGRGRWRVPLLALWCAVVLPAHAGVVIGSTRVVYTAGVKEVPVRFENKNAHPSLMQVWIDAGDENQRAEQADVPFNISPPVFRIESGKQQVARLSHTGEAMPDDRETLYWINALEVPPKAQQEETVSHLQIAFRSRIKMFYRPKGLRPAVTEAPKALVWRLLEEGAGHALEVDNPGPYHLSFDKVEVVAGSLHVPAMLGDEPARHMVKPYARLRIALPPGTAVPAAAASVQLLIIDDYGARLPLQAALLR